MFINKSQNNTHT